jgi:hypothetical protein
VAEPAMAVVVSAAVVAAALKDPHGSHDRFLFDISVHDDLDISEYRNAQEGWFSPSSCGVKREWTT